MKWIKKGKICDYNTFELPWFKKNTMTPVPYLVDEEILRVFVTMCDEKNRGHIGYVDLNPNNPSQIIDYSKEPALGLGEKAMFDEDGVLPSAILEKDNKLWMFYSAYQKQVSIPYTILSGLAVSTDKGRTFTRVMQTPLLDRKEGECFIRSAIEIMQVDDGYLMWYSSGNEWFNRGDKAAPIYNICCMQSTNIESWTGEPQISLKLESDEYGLTMPQVWKEGNIYKMLYSERSISKGYRMGYAESFDGVKFTRKDNLMEIGVSEEGFDSEMICFGKMIRVNGKTYMFYCGNHYGIGGMGYAELEER